MPDYRDSAHSLIEGRTISVVGGGWSFLEQGIDHNKLPGGVIAVNDAMLHLSCKLDSIVSMDRLWTEHRWTTLDRLRVDTFIRTSALKNIPQWGDIAYPEGHNKRSWLYPFQCVRIPIFVQPGKMPLSLNGTNSGGCALNLAFIRKPEELYLFGFDMNRSPEGRAHWYPAYEWVTQGAKGATGTGSYRKWAQEFEVIAQQFREIGTRVYNVSPTSAITAFKRVSAGEIGCTL